MLSYTLPDSIVLFSYKGRKIRFFAGKMEMIELSEISQPKRDKHCPVFLLLGMWEEKNIKVKVEHSIEKEKGRERTRNKWGA